MIFLHLLCKNVFFFPPLVLLMWRSVSVGFKCYTNLAFWTNLSHGGVCFCVCVKRCWSVVLFFCRVFGLNVSVALATKKKSWQRLLLFTECFCSCYYFFLQCLLRLLLLLSRFSRVRLCATPQTAAHQAPPSLRFSRQEHWSGLPFPNEVFWTLNSSLWKDFFCYELMFLICVRLSDSLLGCLFLSQFCQQLASFKEFHQGFQTY